MIMMLFRFFVFLCLRFLEMLEPGEDLDDPSIPAGYNWQKVTDENGDIDILPLREEHTRDASCKCKPDVQIYGSCVMRVHNSFDHREIIEEARDIIQGAKPTQCDPEGTE